MRERVLAVRVPVAVRDLGRVHRGARVGGVLHQHMRDVASDVMAEPVVDSRLSRCLRRSLSRRYDFSRLSGKTNEKPMKMEKSIENRTSLVLDAVALPNKLLGSRRVEEDLP